MSLDHGTTSPRSAGLVSGGTLFGERGSEREKAISRRISDKLRYTLSCNNLRILPADFI
jgi:hypothetical protein